MQVDLNLCSHASVCIIGLIVIIYACRNILYIISIYIYMLCMYDCVKLYSV